MLLWRSTLHHTRAPYVGTLFLMMGRNEGKVVVCEWLPSRVPQGSTRATGSSEEAGKVVDLAVCGGQLSCPGRIEFVDLFVVRHSSFTFSHETRAMLP